jgi:hypothetical protein
MIQGLTGVDSATGCIARAAPSTPPAGAVAGIAITVKRFHLALELDQQRLALAIERLACGHLDPAFADAVFLDVETVLVVQADADVVLENGSHMVRAARVDGQVVGQRGSGMGFGHENLCEMNAGNR